MRLFFLLVSIVSILIFSGCKSDGDIFAVYNEGNISRGEFYKWLESRRYTKATVLQQKVDQKIKLRQLAIDKLSYNEALKAGFDKNMDLAEILELSRENFMSGFFIRKQKNNLEFNEKGVRVKIIKLTIKNFKMENNKRVNFSKSEQEAEIKNQEGRVSEIIEKLGTNESFEKLALEYSDDPSKMKGGDLGYIMAGMREPQVVNAAFVLKPGEFTRAPVRVNDSIYFIKAEDRKEISDKNIESIIGDKSKADAIKKRFQFNRGRMIENDLVNASDVKNNIENAKFRDENEVLFQIGGQDFKYSHFIKIFEFNNKKRKDSSSSPGSMAIEKKKQFSKRILSQKLIMREALKQGMDRDIDFLAEWNNIRIFTIGNEYLNSILYNDLKVTEPEIKEEYERNKDRAYRKKIARGTASVDEVQPLGEVRERILSMLTDRKKSQARKNWEEEILKKSGFKIHDDRLEGK